MNKKPYLNYAIMRQHGKIFSVGNIGVGCLYVHVVDMTGHRVGAHSLHLGGARCTRTHRVIQIQSKFNLNNFLIKGKF